MDSEVRPIYLQPTRKTSTADTHRLKVKGWKGTLDGKQKWAGVAILISDKMHFNTKTVKRQRHHVIVYGSIQQEVVTVPNVYVLDTRSLGYLKPTLVDLKGDADPNTIIMQHLNTTCVSGPKN